LSSDTGFLDELDSSLNNDHTTCRECRPGIGGACNAHRCHATTRKGTRCLSRATKDRGYTWCWAHGCSYRLATGVLCMNPELYGWGCIEHDEQAARLKREEELVAPLIAEYGRP
jgi:hypothetical protein